MKKSRAVTALVLVVALVLSLAAGFLLRGPYTFALNLSPADVTVERIAGRDALVIDHPDFSPTGFDSFFSASFDITFDDNDNYIDIREVAVLVGPFSQLPEHLQPVIIRNGVGSGLLPYKVRYWDGEKFVILGKLRVERVGNGNEDRFSWVPENSHPTEQTGAQRDTTTNQAKKTAPQTDSPSNASGLPPSHGSPSK